ncbi:hypothetical protein QYF61_012629 [Mycteria americana]|uniref:Uncharacterized protein n=1 Tax=Mycteria americana TaxID=33587 RepID=A0AAN7MBC0_MYCAM|nr:hypothetical protein QYF61_012629 [Mycteria americana]
MITLPKTASNHHIAHKSFSVREQEVQRGTFPRWLTHQLRQEVICHTLQEPPGLFPLCCIRAARQDLPLSRDASQGYSSRSRDSLPQQILGPAQQSHQPYSPGVKPITMSHQEQLSGSPFELRGSLPRGEVFQPSDHFCGPPLDPLQQVHVFLVLGIPELDAVLQGWRLNHFPGQPVPMLDNPFGEEKFPNIQSKPPLVQLEAISSRPITCYLGEETDPHLSTTSFQTHRDLTDTEPPSSGQRLMLPIMAELPQ